MTNRKLSAADEIEYQRQLRLLEDGGCLLGDNRHERPFLRVEPGEIGETQAFPLFPSGGVLYAVSVRIVVLTSGSALSHCSLEACGPENLTLLTLAANDTTYRFFEIEFPGEIVLNHWIGQDRLLRRGEVAGGFLLAWGGKPIPAVEKALPGIAVELSLFNQFGMSVHSRQVAPVNPSFMKSMKQRKGSGLFDNNSTARHEGSLPHQVARLGLLDKHKNNETKSEGRSGIKGHCPVACDPSVVSSETSRAASNRGGRSRE